MLSTKISFDYNTIVRDLKRAAYESSIRGLYNNAKWFCHYNHQTKTDSFSEIEKNSNLFESSEQFKKEFKKYLLAKSFFDLKEYQRTAHFLIGCSSPELRFLENYALFLSGEREKHEKQEELRIQNCDSISAITNQNLIVISTKLSELSTNNALDGFELYLYGIVLNESGRQLEAYDVFVQSCIDIPWFYGSWQELAHLASCYPNHRSNYSLPDHWMENFFYPLFELECNRIENSMNLYKELSSSFSSFPFLSAQVAVCHYRSQEIEEAQIILESFHKKNFNSLENMDILSDIYHLKGQTTLLNKLSHELSDSNPFRPETFCVIGNYYSLNKEHEKSILYFKKALQSNPNYVSAWIFIGHEYFSLNNLSKAIACYRQALEIEPNEYRGWFKLGFVYEKMALPFYAMYYYKAAQHIRPFDERISDAIDNLFQLMNQRK